MNGRIVSNTGPIIALTIIDKLDILKGFFHDVVISEAVHHEIIQREKSCAGVTMYLQSSWIKVQPLSNPTDPLLKTVLDSGEASVIQLAQECKADFVLIDESSQNRQRHLWVAGDWHSTDTCGSKTPRADQKCQ